jgi:hypothetical protein
MDVQEKRTTSPCNKLHELPPVCTDWQQTTWCPDCEHYDCGRCDNPIRRDGSAACPFDSKVWCCRLNTTVGDHLEIGRSDVAGP